MAGIGSFLRNNAWLIIGGAVIGVVFRKQIHDFATSISGRLLKRDEKATEIVYRPQPIAGTGQFGRTLGQTRVMSTGEAPPMFDRGRAVGQTVATNPESEITDTPLPMGPVHDPATDTQMFNGAFTDGALKYTVAGFGANYSGSAIGVH
jgi:hypothetical protein